MPLSDNEDNGERKENMTSIYDECDMEERDRMTRMIDVTTGVDEDVDTPERPMTSRTAAKLGYLTPDVIMDRLGVYDLINTKELILRDEGLIGLDNSCADKLMSLEILSLSHNKLTTLTGFQYFVNLIELNLNFNQITSLEYLECPGLEKLFVSNNKIGDLTPLKTLTKLNTLSVYGNVITDLETCLHTCRSMAKLRSLDLGGNPCSREIDGYKFQVIRALPRVKTLDGEQVTQLDKDLADYYMVNGGSTNPSSQSLSRPTTSSGRDYRPLTASQTGRDPLIQPWDAPETPCKQFDAFTSKHMPKGNVRLFRDDFLNNNPILLEYLAQETQAPVSSTEMYRHADNEGGSNSAFVDKMRNANPLSSDVLHESPPPDRNNDDVAVSRPTTACPSTAIAMSKVLTTHLGIDPSDPKTTIRKLLKHIEVLEESLASYTTRRVEAAESALVEENRRLQMENNNIPILQSQITALKKQIEAFKTPPCPAPTVAAKLSSNSGVVATTRVSELELENEQLRKENVRLKHLLKGGNGDVSTTEPVTKIGVVISMTSNGCVSGPGMTSVAEEDELDARIQSKRLAQNPELLEDSASIDVELTELILQNEVALELIRNDIKSTKKEWEVQFQEAKEKELERQRMRPQTSLGLSGSGTLTRLMSGTERPISAIKVGSSPVPPAANDKSKKSRQLHTSAGFQHNGPEKRLLQPATQATHIRSSTRSEHSVTNILTL